MNPSEMREYAQGVLSLPGVFHPKIHRIVEGVVLTSKTLSQGYSRSPEGAEFKLPLPLLVRHSHIHPLGWVISATKGPTLRFKARIANDRLAWADPIWEQLKTGEVDAVSFGSDVSQEDHDYSPGRRHDITKWSWIELSIVERGASEDALIHLVKEADSPGVLRFDGSKCETVFRDVRAIYDRSLPKAPQPTIVRLR